MTIAELEHCYQAQRDVYCLAEIFKRQTKLLLVIGHKYIEDAHLLQDVLQNTFEKALNVLPKKAQLPNITGWLYTVFKNDCLKAIGKQKLTALINHIDTPLATHAIADTAHITPWWQDEELKRAMVEALLTLKPEQKLCLIYFYIHGMRYEDISAQTGYQIGQVKSYIQNGKRMLKNQLEALKMQKDDKR